MNNILVAIDPGASGGYAMFQDGKCFGAWKYTTYAEFIDHLEEYILCTEKLEIVLEDCPPFAGKNIPSSAGFKLGKSCGYYEGLARGMGLPCYLVKPTEWQRGLPNLKKSTGPQRKRILRDHAIRMCPIVKDQITLATADAVLIGLWFLNNNKK